jgi:hypothetical protein
MESPENSGKYLCNNCGNIRSFIGYDDRGYPGPDECECGKDLCECEVTLKQHFMVEEDGDLDYHAFAGGGYGADIGAYTRIQCAVCNEFIWTEAINSGADKTPSRETPNRKEDA